MYIFVQIFSSIPVNPAKNVPTSTCQIQEVWSLARPLWRLRLLKKLPGSSSTTVTKATHAGGVQITLGFACAAATQLISSCAVIARTFGMACWYHWATIFRHQTALHRGMRSSKLLLKLNFNCVSKRHLP